MEYLFKGAAGAAVVLLIAFLAKTRYFYLAGLAPLFPTFALFAHVITYQETGGAGLKVVAVFGLLAIIPYALYLVTILLCIDRYAFSTSISLAVGAWFLSAFVVVGAWNWLEVGKGAAG